MKLAKETWVILAIGLADLITTILFIKHHGAQEANPIFKWYWEMGIAAFVCAKMALLVGPLSILEWARHRSPKFVSMALRSAIAGYVLMYGVGYYRLNHAPLPASDNFSVQTIRAQISRRTGESVRPLSRSIKQAGFVSPSHTEGEAVTVF